MGLDLLDGFPIKSAEDLGQTKAHFGMIGLGTMGRNFLLNIAEHGISGDGYDLDAGKRDLLLKEGNGMPLDVGGD